MPFLTEFLVASCTTLIWMAGLATLFGALAYFMPCNPGMGWWKDRRGVRTDLAYWLLAPLVLRFGRTLLLAGGTALIFGISGQEEMDEFFRYGHGPVSQFPIWQQGLAILVLEDCIMYWIHRVFHTNHLWRFHAVHHSPTTLDWMTSARFHPVNVLFYSTFADIVMLLLGFSPMALAWLGPFNVIYSGMVHANLNWTFGPFRYVMASPVFHRWHHTSVKHGGMSNFAPTFPVLDVIFGTFYMPQGKLPEKYGVFDPDFPTGFWAQMLYPFRRAR